MRLALRALPLCIDPRVNRALHGKEGRQTSHQPPIVAPELTGLHSVAQRARIQTSLQSNRLNNR
jgi:hypothetical protein